jgi:hypothetical protein
MITGKRSVRARFATVMPVEMISAPGLASRIQEQKK